MNEAETKLELDNESRSLGHQIPVFLVLFFKIKNGPKVMRGPERGGR